MSKKSKTSTKPQINVSEFMETCISDYHDMEANIREKIMNKIEDNKLIIKTPGTLYNFIEQPDAIIKRFNEVISGVFDLKTFKWDNIAVAGGFMVQCANKALRTSDLMEYVDKDGDIDFYIYGVETAEQFNERVKYIFEKIKEKTEITSITRTKNAFTINLNHTRNFNCKIQIILGKFADIKSIFAHYDLKICCMAYDGSKFMISKTAQTMAMEHCMVIDCAGPMMSYSRVVKYLLRGFNLHLLNVNPDNILLDKRANIYRLLTITARDSKEDREESPYKLFMQNAQDSINNYTYDNDDIIEMLKINPYITHVAFNGSSSGSDENSKYSNVYRMIYRNTSKYDVRELVTINKINDSRALEIITAGDKRNDNKKVKTHEKESQEDGETKEENKTESTIEDEKEIKKVEKKFDDNIITFNELTAFINCISTTNDNSQAIENAGEYFSDKPIAMKYKSLEEAIRGQIKHVSRGSLMMVCGNAADFEDIYAGRVPKYQFEKIIADWADAYMNKYVLPADLHTKIQKIDEMKKYIDKFNALNKTPLVLVPYDPYMVIDITEKSKAYDKWY